MLKQILAVLLFLPAAALALSVNEVSPKGTEWIEIYNPDGSQLNMSEWLIKGVDSDLNYNDTIDCLQCLTDANYILIIGKNTDVSAITPETVTYFKTKKYIGINKNGLKDDGDTAIISNGNQTIQFSYTGSSDGKSWCLMPDGFSAIQECSPTPGKANFNQETTTSTSTTTSTMLAIQETVSSIKITKISKPKLNEPIDVSFTVTKGDTQKYAIYAWVDESRKSIIHVREQGTFDFQIPVYVKEPCRDHTLVIEGLDLREEVPLEKVACSSGGVQIKIIEIPEEINANDSIDLKVSLFNEDDSEKNIDLSSYFYLGSDIASLGLVGSAWEGGPSANRVALVLAPGDIINVTLKNKLKEMAKGKYYLKIKAHDGLKEYQYEKEVHVGKKKAEPKAEEAPKKEIPQITGFSVRKPSFFQKLFAPLSSLIDGIKGLF